MTWRTGDTGTTRGGQSYRVVCDDAAGDRGRLVVLLKLGDEEMVHRMPDTGVHPGNRAFDLLPARARG